MRKDPNDFSYGDDETGQFWDVYADNAPYNEELGCPSYSVRAYKLAVKAVAPTKADYVRLTTDHNGEYGVKGSIPTFEELYDDLRSYASEMGYENVDEDVDNEDWFEDLIHEEEEDEPWLGIDSLYESKRNRK